MIIVIRIVISKKLSSLSVEAEYPVQVGVGYRIDVGLQQFLIWVDRQL